MAHQSTSVFPETFLWGVATAAHQVEGNNVNSDTWLFENVEDTAFMEPSGDAMDHYHRFPEDIALIASLGLTSYRLSVEWSRIEPSRGLFSKAELAHYREVLQCCCDNGLKTIVTLHHFTSPIWLLAQGGWESPETPSLFARYCARVVEEMGDLMDYACTMNEPNLAWLLADVGATSRNASDRAEDPMFRSVAKALGVEPASLAQFQFAATERAFDVKLAAHKAAVDAVHAIRPDLPAGWTLVGSPFKAAPGGEERAAAAREEICDRFYRASAGDDFVGIQTYSRSWYGADGPVDPPAGVELTQRDEEFYPEAIEESLRAAWDQSGTPLFVTENGIASEDDEQRERFLDRAVAGVGRCVRDGIPVLGYTCWSAFDNFEWVFGYGPKYGIISVDRETQRRTVKPSATHLGSIARCNGACVEIGDAR